ALAVVLVLLPHLLHLRGELLHLARRADLAKRRLEQEHTEREHQEEDRERPREPVVRPDDETENLVPKPQDGGHRVKDETKKVRHSATPDHRPAHYRGAAAQPHALRSAPLGLTRVPRAS